MSIKHIVHILMSLFHRAGDSVAIIVFWKEINEITLDIKIRQNKILLWLNFFKYEQIVQDLNNSTIYKKMLR